MQLKGVGKKTISDMYQEVLQLNFVDFLHFVIFVTFQAFEICNLS